MLGGVRGHAPPDPPSTSNKHSAKIMVKGDNTWMHKLTAQYVRHFLLECGDFAQVRNNCFHVNNMKELFQDIHIDSIMTFLRQINLFNKI